MCARTGEALTHIVLEVVKEIDIIASKLNKKPTVIIKSTVPVGTTSAIDNDTENCNVIFSPEFLTEANAVNDFKNQNRIILGINRNSYDVKPPEFAIAAKKVFQDIFIGKAEIIITGSPIAEMLKYVTNTFLATKVSFANEIYKITEASGINYNEVIELAKLDKRLGDSHWMVPGPDGDFGFGGHCFPKDLQALRFIAKQLKIDTKVLDATLSTNDEVRNNRDWERQEGRAIVNFNSKKTNSK
jgi:UDPglucose 6-dehydrogenase